MGRYTTLVVGTHFRPPAKQVIAVLPSGAKLRLEQDNDNAYDPSAVRVLVELDQIPESQFPALEAELPNFGLTFDQLMSTGPVFLGYIPAQDGKPLAKARMGEPELLGNQQVRELAFDSQGLPDPDVTASLSFAPDGSVRIHLDQAD